VHLEKDGLCRVQRVLGHDYLPETCREYPRVMVERGSLRFETLHLSCPAVTDWLVKQTDESSLFLGDFGFRVPGISDSDTVNLSHVINFIGICTERLMSLEDFSLDLRLWYLGNLLSELSDLVEKDTLDLLSLRKLFDSETPRLKRRLSELEKRSRKRRKSVDKALAARFWHLVFMVGGRFQGLLEGEKVLKGSRFARLVLEYTHSVDTEKKLLRLLSLSDETRGMAFRKSQSVIKTVLKKYLIVKFANHGFPWAPFQNNFIVTFLDCLVPYFQIQALCGLHVESYGKISRSDISRYMYQVEKNLSHNLLVIENLAREPDLLKLEKYNASWYAVV